MIDAIKKIFSINDLRQKVVYTLLLLLVCRIGSFIPVPGINQEAALKVFKAATGGSQNLFQLMDLFSGGAFAQLTMVALGIMPYISASIIMQLLVAIIPSFQRETRENPEAAKRKITKYTRLATMILALGHSFAIAKYALNMNMSHPGVIASEILNITFNGTPLLFYITIMVTMSTGVVFLMWIGEQITEKGIGNGISLIITTGILAALPGTIGSIIKQLNLSAQDAGQLSFISLLILLSVFILIIVGTILVIQGQRKIPVQYARRGATDSACASHIPLKINYAGVIPVIFASSFLMFPATIGQLVGKNSVFGKVSYYLSPGSWVYLTLYVLLILFFTYFWTASQFNPEQIASDMKKNGAFIPGIRQGKPTQDYLENSMNKITLIGGVFLALIAIFPTIVSKLLGVDARIAHFFGGTSLLILVGVILDTAKQVESHLLTQRYEGFMKKVKIRGR
ncbi:MAG: preprotein translocase subunit SecY [Chlamydiae bacterium RIFCSPHIGHO2_12_FULL_27_8]|nr:MAG: preprotein translocase subunit SecY [Chlamydiae bacterium RIFCSPHIGHO2_12_FULL_27_8]